MTGEKENDVTSACADMLMVEHAKLKQKYFDGVPANQVRTTSPCSSMTNEQWRKLVDMWSNPKHKVWFMPILVFCESASCTRALHPNVSFKLMNLWAVNSIM